MTTTCTATARSGRPCRAPAIRWPYGADGNPVLCAKHAPEHVRQTRDALFAEENRRDEERLTAIDPGCWSWPTALDWTQVADYYGGPVEALRQRFNEGERSALRIAFAAWHDNRCAVCGFREKQLVTDHDHDTGLMRGLLCPSCNGSEPHNNGPFQKYRERPPAQIIGIHLRYWDPFNGWAQPRAIEPHRLDNHPAYGLAARLAARLEGDRGDC